MNKQIVSLLILCLVPFATGATTPEGKSARRDPNVSYEAYKAQAWFTGQDQHPSQASAIDSAVTVARAQSQPVTQWWNAQELNDRFNSLRDVRFLYDQDHPKSKRRSTWLYPDDGCYARAALAIRNLAGWSFPVPQKIFVFGNLAVKTKNAPGGEVTWWYHVAPIVEVAGQKFVLDPAIHPAGPLPLLDWLRTMTKDVTSLEVAICGAGAYTPYDVCEKNSDGIEKLAQEDQIGFLTSEWDRLRQLRRDPEKELGDLPPWL